MKLSESLSQTSFSYLGNDDLNILIIVLIASLSAFLFLLILSYLDIKLNNQKD